MSIRHRGLLVFLLCGGIFSVIVYWIANPSTYPFDFYPAGPGGALLIGAPGGLAIIGLLELASGKPFYQLEAAWASLKMWQQALFGFCIIAVAGTGLFVALAYLLL